MEIISTAAPETTFKIIVKDHNWKFGYEWFKQAWQLSHGARLYFLGLLILSVIPYGLGLIPYWPELLKLFMEVFGDLLGGLLVLGTLLCARLWAFERKKNWRLIYSTFKISSLYQLGPLIPLFILLSLIDSYAKAQEMMPLQIISTLISIFLRDSMALKLIYGLTFKKSLVTSVYGCLLNFWALIVLELVFLFALIFGLGVPAVAILPMFHITFNAIYNKEM